MNLGKLTKGVLILSVLLVVFSISYYFVIFLPEKEEAKLELQKDKFKLELLEPKEEPKEEPNPVIKPKPEQSSNNQGKSQQEWDKFHQELEKDLEENRRLQKEAEEAFKQAEEEKARQEAEESYTYHNYYPIILSLSDNKGSIIKYSSYNGYKESYPSAQRDTILKIGDEIHLKAEASDPQNRQILYSWHSNSDHFNQLIGLEEGHYKWSTDNEIRYTITSETAKTAGELLSIEVQIKSEKEYLRFPGGGYDDTTYLNYALLP